MPSITSTDSNHITYDRQPNKCPYCHNSIMARPFLGARIVRGADIVFQCPDDNCKKLFIGHYLAEGGQYRFLNSTNIGNPITREFNPSVGTVSPMFIQIYGEAESAEHMGLIEICGVGYRKSLEFLIKDYAILNHEDKAEAIKKSTLANCIKQYVNDSRIQTVADRAAWLGNDETHYVRKWEGKDLSDLKILINLAVHWIEMEMLTKEYNDSMPK